MRRLAIILCFVPRVIYGTYSVQHEAYSTHISRKSRSNLPTYQSDYVYRHFDKPGMYSAIGPATIDPYRMDEHQESKSLSKITKDSTAEYEGVIIPHTTPSILQSEVDYAIAKAAADARYDSSRSASDNSLEKLKSLMHYRPPPDMSENMSGYDGSEYHMDDDDVRSSSRSLYDNYWPYFYHSPYEYEHNKDIFDMEKAKDKRYVSEDHTEHIIPVQEIIDNDFPEGYDNNKHFRKDGSENPIKGDAPFLSFVLNDYYEKNYEEDPLIFKGLGWGKEFDHETYFPNYEDNKRHRRIENTYFTTISPVTGNQGAYEKLSKVESATDSNTRREHEFNKRENGANKNSEHKTGYENGATKYNGFKDFLDSFANKFGNEDLKKKSNYIHSTNQDKGENRKGFRRVYHKDEYQEDNEFFDNNNSSKHGVEEGSANAHLGGSEAYLRSQAAAAVGNQMNAIQNAGNTKDENFENRHEGYDKQNTLANHFKKFRDVAKETAQSNIADYSDPYKII